LARRSSWTSPLAHSHAPAPRRPRLWLTPQAAGARSIRRSPVLTFVQHSADGPPRAARFAGCSGSFSNGGLATSDLRPVKGRNAQLLADKIKHATPSPPASPAFAIARSHRRLTPIAQRKREISAVDTTDHPQRSQPCANPKGSTQKQTKGLTQHRRVRRHLPPPHAPAAAAQAGIRASQERQASRRCHSTAPRAQVRRAPEINPTVRISRHMQRTDRIQPHGTP